MKKSIIALSALILSCASVSAQSSIFFSDNNKAYLGVRVGADVTCPGNVKDNNISIDMFKNGGGIEFGAIYNIPVIANLYIEPGLKLYYDTYSADIDIIEAITGYNSSSLTVKKFGMRIPVMAGYHFDFINTTKAYVFTGPELELGISAKEHLKVGKVSESESLYGEDGSFKRVNCLWNIGAGISYQQFYFGINGAIGMLNMYKESQPKFHENRVTFSIGYNF